MSVSDTLIDTLFDGRYRIVRRIGAGGMANVYLAEDEVLGRRVAIKILNDRHANDEQFVERFRREAKNAAGLSHPNIVSIYDRGEAEGTYYIAMEHLDGRNLKELILARGPAPLHVAVDYGRQVLDALRFAHRNGIVHRDIKPHNVLVDGDGRLKVTDFGIARAGASQMTEAGSIVGTAQYLSPEQARGAPVDQRSDLYSVGVVLYELLTGEVPFSGDSPVEIAMKHLSEQPPLPSAKRPEVPHDLDLVVARALAKDPADRYESAEEMDADLARIDDGGGVSERTNEAATAIISGAAAMPTQVTRVAPEARTPYRPGPPPAPPPVYYDLDEEPRRRRPVWPWLLPLLLVLVALGLGFVVYQQIQDQLAADEPVAVPNVVGIREALARQELDERGIEYRVEEEATTEQPRGFVFAQDPEAGRRIDKETDVVTLRVSTGPPTVDVPDVRGMSQAEAVRTLTEAELNPIVRKVPSNEPEDTVVAQDPRPDEQVEVGTDVRINVSSGPKPLAVPNVVGRTFEDASAALQAAGFAVARAADRESNAPAGTVIEQSPAGDATAARGATVTLTVSTGPSTVEVPDVTQLDRDAAVAQLEDEGFEAEVAEEPVDDPTQDGIVIAQDPGPGAQTEPGSTVTLTVGVFSGGPPPETQ